VYATSNRPYRASLPAARTFPVRLAAALAALVALAMSGAAGASAEQGATTTAPVPGPSAAPVEQAGQPPSPAAGAPAASQPPATPATPTAAPSPATPSPAAGQAPPNGQQAVAPRIVGPSVVIAGSTVRFEAVGGPHAASGPGPLYSWDLMGTGRFTDPAPVPTITHVFWRTGTFRVGLLVRGEQGPQPVAHLQVTVIAPRGASRRRARSHGVPHASTRAPLAHAAAGVSVTIKDFSFGPAGITVHAGDTVTWVNEGPSNHTATAPGTFDTGILHSGQSASQVFTHAGTFAYRCSIHPFMRGTVTVLAASSSTPSSGSGSEANGGGTGAGAGPGEASTAGGAAATARGPALPNTGLDIRTEVALGVAMLLTGLALLLAAARRDRAQARRSRD
jgi:plastocyanin